MIPCTLVQILGQSGDPASWGWRYVCNVGLHKTPTYWMRYAANFISCLSSEGLHISSALIFKPTNPSPTFEPYTFNIKFNIILSPSPRGRLPFNICETFQAPFSRTICHIPLSLAQNLSFAPVPKQTQIMPFRNLMCGWPCIVIQCG